MQQAVILRIFDGVSERLSYEELLTASGTEPAVLERVLDSLTNQPRFKLLLRHAVHANGSLYSEFSHEARASVVVDAGADVGADTGPDMGAGKRGSSGACLLRASVFSVNMDFKSQLKRVRSFRSL